MLPERKARTCTQDAAAKTTRLEVTSGGGAARDQKATILLDARGAVIGVDVDPDGPGRTVVMYGKHEDVKSTRSTSASVARTADGAVASVTVRS